MEKEKTARLRITRGKAALLTMRTLSPLLIKLGAPPFLMNSVCPL